MTSSQPLEITDSGSQSPTPTSIYSAFQQILPPSPKPDNLGKVQGSLCDVSRISPNHLSSLCRFLKEGAARSELFFAQCSLRQSPLTTERAKFSPHMLACM
ncbi:hypothetical protein KIL84_023365 [Mauremys mutica]|uniref:Uncharacterized protein n=1 Tax=Mauremys mutica TaxID=74926 RepID=A0A9D3WRU6_9SAUR|nr:hypothetical protein KIL84_023365 [Mauremys mutica]